MVLKYNMKRWYAYLLLLLHHHHHHHHQQQQQHHHLHHHHLMSYYHQIIIMRTQKAIFDTIWTRNVFSSSWDLRCAITLKGAQIDRVVLHRSWLLDAQRRPISNDVNPISANRTGKALGNLIQFSKCYKQTLAIRVTPCIPPKRLTYLSRMVSVTVGACLEWGVGWGGWGGEGFKF